MEGWLGGTRGVNRLQKKNRHMDNRLIIKGVKVYIYRQGSDDLGFGLWKYNQSNGDPCLH